MTIRTFHADSVKDFVRSCHGLTTDGFSPSVAMVFASVALDLHEIGSTLKKMNVRVIGSSSCGEFLYNKENQKITEGSVVCLFMDLRPGTYDIRLFPGKGLPSFDLGKEIGKWAGGLYRDPALIVLGSGLENDGEQLVRGVQAMAGEGLIMFGGLAGDDAQFRETFVFSEEKPENNGAIVLALDKDHIDITGIATSGWVSIGADKVVTGSHGNIVFTIDDQPALDVYKEYLNVRDEDLPEIGIEYPLMLKKPGGGDILRAVINVDRESKSLIFAGSVPAGSIVTFSSSPGFEIIESTKQRVVDFHNQNPVTDLLLLFSCMARHSALGPTIAEEIETAWNLWKVPVIGFFTYGEIGNNYTGSCDFYNQTYTLVSIKQKADAE